jgi:hypothetical protein
LDLARWGWGWASSCDLQIERPYSTNSCRRGTTHSGGNQILANRIYDDAFKIKPIS